MFDLLIGFWCFTAVMLVVTTRGLIHIRRNLKVKKHPLPELTVEEHIAQLEQELGISDPVQQVAAPEGKPFLPPPPPYIPPPPVVRSGSWVSKPDAKHPYLVFWNGESRYYER